MKGNAWSTGERNKELTGVDMNFRMNVKHTVKYYTITLLHLSLSCKIWECWTFFKCGINRSVKNSRSMGERHLQCECQSTGKRHLWNGERYLQALQVDQVDQGNLSVPKETNTRYGKSAEALNKREVNRKHTFWYSSQSRKNRTSTGGFLPWCENDNRSFVPSKICMLTLKTLTDKFSAIHKESIYPSVWGSDFPLAVLTEKLCWGGCARIMACWGYKCLPVWVR